MFIVLSAAMAKAPLGATCSDPGSLDRLKYVALIVRNMMPFQKRSVFLLKRLSAMMRLLIENVVGNTVEMGMGRGKRAVTFLPRKPASQPPLLVNVIGRSCLDVADQVCWSDARFQTEQQMCVITHAVDRNQFLAFSCDNSSDVFL